MFPGAVLVWGENRFDAFSVDDAQAVGAPLWGPLGVWGPLPTPMECEAHLRVAAVVWLTLHKQGWDGAEQVGGGTWPHSIWGGGRQGMVGKEVQCQDWGARSQVANPRVFLSNPMIAVEQDLHRPHYQPSSNT